MENIKKGPEIFAFTLKLNKLDVDILQYLAKSFELQIEGNKIDLIDNLIKKINTISEKEFKDINVLIDQHLKDNNTQNKFKKNKLNYIEYINSLDENSKKEILEESKDIKSKIFKKKKNFETLLF